MRTLDAQGKWVDGASADGVGRTVRQFVEITPLPDNLRQQLGAFARDIAQREADTHTHEFLDARRVMNALLEMAGETVHLAHTADLQRRIGAGVPTETVIAAATRISQLLDRASAAHEEQSRVVFDREDHIRHAEGSADPTTYDRTSTVDR